VSQTQTIDAPASQHPPLDLLQRASLFLDFDGTLVELEARPDETRVSDRVRALMAKRSAKLDGRLAIISGRPLDQIDALFGGVDFAISGSHGLEVRMPDGSLIAPVRPAGLDHALGEIRGLQAKHEGLVIEDKPFGVALHYRLAPHTEAECRALVRAMAEQDGLQLQLGKMMAEVRVAGKDKGHGLRALMQSPAMFATRPVFIGDDDTDEPALAAAEEMGGAGIVVDPVRPSAARYRLDDVAATLAWLESAAERMP
jgi:trehalose 6-phosphate phosphatase